MTVAERDRLKEFLWLILPAGSRSPSRLDWIVDGIEQGRFPTSRDAHKGGADAAQAACEHECAPPEDGRVVRGGGAA